MDFLKEKEDRNGVHLTAYASGDGSLSLVFQRNHNKEVAHEVRVTSRDIDAFKERRPELKNWKKYYNGAGFRLYRPVERISKDEVYVDGMAYRYVRTHEQCFTVFTEDGRETKNSNICGAIMFFVNNEEGIAGQDR